MIWNANFADGSSVNENKLHWPGIPSDKEITGLQLQHVSIPNIKLTLKDLDFYYFTNEAVASFGESRCVAKIIGGHNTKLGVGIEIKLSENGSVIFREYPISQFKYDKSLLKRGALKKS